MGTFDSCKIAEESKEHSRETSGWSAEALIKNFYWASIHRSKCSDIKSKNFDAILLELEKRLGIKQHIIYF